MHRFESKTGRLWPAWPPRRPRVLAARCGGLALVAASLAAPVHAQPASAALPTPAPVAEAEATTLVSGFDLQGNSLLDPAALQALLQRWLGPRTLAELGQAAQAVQAQYSRAGYGAVVAYLPPQAVANGTVTIAVLEGRLARVTVQGQQRLSAERVRAALPTLVEGRTPAGDKIRNARQAPGPRRMGPGVHQAVKRLATGFATHFLNAPSGRCRREPQVEAASRSMNRSHCASCSSVTNSSGAWACAMSPGPQITVGMPIRWNKPASVPYETLPTVSLRESCRASLTIASSSCAASPSVELSQVISIFAIASMLRISTSSFFA